MTGTAGDRRAELLETIETRRACINTYVRAKAPISTRLSTISIVSSGLAAALVAGPALGGGRFAAAAADGLGRGNDLESVWRPLCFVALVVSVTAAITTNLAKSHDLAARIAAAETAGAMLHGLHTRLKFARLPLDDGAQEYQDIVAGIPFVPEHRMTGKSGAGAGSWGAWLVIVLAVTAAILATVVLVTSLVGFFRGASDQRASGPAPTGSSGAVPSTSEPPSPTSSSPSPSVNSSDEATDVFAGADQTGDVSFAFVTDGERASAYLCDGANLEAWLEGEVVGSAVSLSNSSGASLTGTLSGATLKGTFSRDGLTLIFTAREAAEPAGLYEAKIPGNGEIIRVGWVVLPDGTQVGILSDRSRGIMDPAPNLNTDTLKFTWNGREISASRKGP